MESLEFKIHSHNWENALLALSKNELKELCNKLQIPFENKTKERMATLISRRIDLDKGITLTINLEKQ